MLEIYPPEIKAEGHMIKVSVLFKRKGQEMTLWYSLNKKYKGILVTERTDAFVVGLLFLGLKTGEHIHVYGKLSKRLHYSLNKYLIKAICLANKEFFPIKITADSLDDINLNIHPKAGTGMSCGVDSLATFVDHKNLEAPYKIQYFTFFNVGSHGDNGGENSRKIFRERLRRIKKFSSDFDIEVIQIDSNLSELLQLNFQKTHTLRSISCVLLLQKLFRNFYYASSIRFDQFTLDKVRIAEYDLLNLQLLSTESTTLWSSASQYNRIERVNLISNFKSSYKVLDVCSNPNIGEEKINCSNCDKCVRTMLILDTLGRLNLYKSVFDIDYYRKMKSAFIARIKAKRNKETQDIQVLKLLKNNGHVDLKINFKFFKLKSISLLKNLKKNLR